MQLYFILSAIILFLITIILLIATGKFAGLLAWINIQIEWLKSFWNEPDGKASNKRLLSTAVVTAFVIPYLKVSIYSKDLKDIPMGWAIMISSIIGLNIADYFVKGYINKSVKQDDAK